MNQNAAFNALYLVYFNYIKFTIILFMMHRGGGETIINNISGWATPLVLFYMVT